MTEFIAYATVAAGFVGVTCTGITVLFAASNPTRREWRDVNRLAYAALMCFFLFLAGLVTLVYPALWAPKPEPVAAVCTTDSDCAEWERRNNIPLEDRCYGAPCPAKK